VTASTQSTVFVGRGQMPPKPVTPRKINVHTEFELDPSEEVLIEIQCSLDHKAPFAGFLLVTQNHLCFRSLSQARVVKVRTTLTRCESTFIESYLSH
jgi:hypothetical protein